MNYADFVSQKLSIAAPSGLVTIGDLPASLFPHQADLVRWALQRGRAAIFADTGLGKSRMQVAWADQVHKATGRDVLILAPLAVAAQTVEEGERLGVTITHAREAWQVMPGINITNYDRLHKFDRILDKLMVRPLDLAALWEVSESARIPTHWRMGKHKGCRIDETPDDYLRWMQRQPDLDPYLAKAIDRALYSSALPF